MNELADPEGDTAPKAPKDPARAARRAVLMKDATKLHKQGDYAAALERWAELRELSPKLRLALLGAVRSASAAARGDLVEDLVSQGVSLFPSSADKIRKAAGRTIVELDDEVDWQALLARPPANGDRELKAAVAPLEQKRGRKGREGQARMNAVLPRVESVVARYPGHLKARLEHVGLLRDLARHADAARAAATYRRELPDAERLVFAQASALEEGHDYEAALGAIADQEATPRVKARRARLLSRLGRSEEAEAALVAALAEEPKDVDLLGEYAMQAVRRGDWTEALNRWQEAEKLLPDSERVKNGLTMVRQQLAQFEPPPPSGPKSESAVLFNRFESLGATSGGCEFGMVQGQYGCAGLGMLRWSNIQIESLLRGINRTFEGVGLLENTTLRIARRTPTREEYLLRDMVYNFGGHTFVEPKNVPEDKMLAQSAKRLAFLRNKLIEEMRSGKKIFVFKLANPVEDEVLLEIGDALARLGPGRLLCAVKANAAHPKGTIRQVSGHVFAAHFGHFMSNEDAENRGIDFAAWHDVCTRVASLVGSPVAARVASPGEVPA